MIKSVRSRGEDVSNTNQLPTNPFTEEVVCSECWGSITLDPSTCDRYCEDCGLLVRDDVWYRSVNEAGTHSEQETLANPEAFEAGTSVHRGETWWLDGDDGGTVGADDTIFGDGQSWNKLRKGHRLWTLQEDRPHPASRHYKFSNTQEQGYRNARSKHDELRRMKSQYDEVLPDFVTVDVLADWLDAVQLPEGVPELNNYGALRFLIVATTLDHLLTTQAGWMAFRSGQGVEMFDDDATSSMLTQDCTEQRARAQVKQALAFREKIRTTVFENCQVSRWNKWVSVMAEVVRPSGGDVNE